MKKLLKNLVNWSLLLMVILFLISGFALVHKYGCDSILTRDMAKLIHKNLAIPFIIVLTIHVLQYTKIKIGR